MLVVTEDTVTLSACCVIEGLLSFNRHTRLQIPAWPLAARTEQNNTIPPSGSHCAVEMQTKGF